MGCTRKRPFCWQFFFEKTRLHNFLVLPKAGADYFSEVVCSNFLEWVKPTPHDNATWEFEMVETAKASVDEFLGKKLVQWKLENQEQEKECVVKCASVMRKNSGCWFENRPKPRIVARYEGMIEWKNLAQSHSYYLFCVENICTQQQKHIRAEILKEQGWIKALTIKKNTDQVSPFHHHELNRKGFLFRKNPSASYHQHKAPVIS